MQSPNIPTLLLTSFLGLRRDLRHTCVWSHWNLVVITFGISKEILLVVDLSQCWFQRVLQRHEFRLINIFVIMQVRHLRGWIVIVYVNFVPLRKLEIFINNMGFLWDAQTLFVWLLFYEVHRMLGFVLCGELREKILLLFGLLVGISEVDLYNPFWILVIDRSKVYLRNDKLLSF